MRRYGTIALLLVLTVASACTGAGGEPGVPSATGIVVPSSPPSPTGTPPPAASPTPTSSPTPIPTPTISPTPVPVLHGPPYTVAIDPGHGGVDYSGSSHRAADGEFAAEKDLTLDVALRLDALLRESGYNTLLTRDGDYSLTPFDPADPRSSQRNELQARVDKSNDARADVLIALHFNGSSDPSLSGLEVYYNPDRSFGAFNQALAVSVHDALMQAIRGYGYVVVKDRGVKNDAEVGGDPQNEHSYLLGTNDDFRPSLMPGVIAEPLFLSNTTEATLLAKPEFRDVIARGYQAGIDAYFGWLQAQVQSQ